MHKFWTENVFWWNFWSKIKKNWYQKALNIVFWGGKNVQKLLSHLRSAPANLSKMSL